jgi:chromosome segregation ATPase
MTPHRRRRSETEEDENDDRARSSQNSTSSTSDTTKRTRRDGYGPGTPSGSSEPDDSRIRSVHGRQNTANRASDGDSTMEETTDGATEFQPGAIVRVRLTNFVTYESAEFLPGPNLNMVIGPNGTGKSSLVCAICLGLGWGPQHLGRATQIGEFIKHGLEEAYIEIELQRRRKESHNYIVRVKIIREGNGREWWLNGKKTSLKAVQALTRSLSIQIDNLCQFLPQDKVSEFAALSPVELLQQTQRAAAPEQMLEWHEELKKLRKDQKQLEEQHERDKEHLETQETRQENLRAEVQRLEERNQIQDRVALLKKTVPFVEYRTARIQHKKFKKKKEEAQGRLEDLKAQIEPTLQSVNHKREYRDRISTIVKERKNNVQAAERAADSILVDMEKLDGSIQDIEQKADAERQADESRKKDLLKIQRRIKELQNRLQEEPIEFNSVEWNGKIVSGPHARY